MTRFQQRHLVAALGRFGGGGQTRWASADHGNALFCAAAGGVDFRIGSWQARGFTRQEVILPAEGVVQAGLVAANAGVDLVVLARRPPCSRTPGRPGSGRAIDTMSASPLGEDLLGHIRRVDAVGGDQRDAAPAPRSLRGHPGKGGARHLGGDGRNARLVPADAGVEDRSRPPLLRPAPVAPLHPACSRLRPGRASTGGR